MQRSINELLTAIRPHVAPEGQQPLVELTLLVNEASRTPSTLTGTEKLILDAVQSAYPAVATETFIRGRMATAGRRRNQSNFWAHLCRLRAKLKKSGLGRIDTVRTVGYLWVPTSPPETD